MAGKPEAGGIGQERGVQNPDNALKQGEGEYKDPVEAMPETEKLPTTQFPLAPGPQPLTNIRGGQ